MGEKGIGDVATSMGAAAVAPAAGSLVENATSLVTTAVTGAGSDLAGVVKDKSIGAVADNVVQAAREKLTAKELAEDALGVVEGEPPTAHDA